MFEEKIFSKNMDLNASSRLITFGFYSNILEYLKQEDPTHVRYQDQK